MVKTTNAMNVFNMLQDLRHLIILDFRSEQEFNESHIRKAVRVTPETYKQVIASCLVSLKSKVPDAPSDQITEVQKKEISVDDAAAKALKKLVSIENGDVTAVDGRVFASEYKQDDLKRVLMILPEDAQNIKQLETMVSTELPPLGDEILKIAQQRLSKVFYLKEFTAFQKKYPLLCIPHPCMNELQAITSMSRFPSELKKDMVYFGNLTNVLSKDYVQLKMLGIKTIVHFTPQKFDSLEKEFNCIHYEVKTFNKELETLPIHSITDQI